MCKLYVKMHVHLKTKNYHKGLRSPYSAKLRGKFVDTSLWSGQ